MSPLIREQRIDHTPSCSAIRYAHESHHELSNPFMQCGNRHTGKTGMQVKQTDYSTS
jgi:hypothetical protein